MKQTHQREYEAQIGVDGSYTEAGPELTALSTTTTKVPSFLPCASAFDMVTI